jgi:DNA-3-methyladenine glycosylase
MARLPREFYDRPTLLVARDLIGKRLVHDTRAGRASGVIVEVEAYIGEADAACHAAAGRTRRNALLYGDPGFAYVYLNYGMHYLVNAVTEPKDAPAAVLIRALDPRDGIALMRRRRVNGTQPTRALDDEWLCRGPGNLTKALGISLDENGVDLCGSRLYVEDAGEAFDAVTWGRRIGISAGTEAPWRCYVAGHRSVSGNKEQGTGNREQGTRNKEQGTGNKEQGTRNNK